MSLARDSSGVHHLGFMIGKLRLERVVVVFLVYSVREII